MSDVITLPFTTQVVKINISESFMPRARCKECGKGPEFYYATYKPFIWKDIKYFFVYTDVAKKWFSGNNSWFKGYAPKYFTKASDFSRKLPGKSYSPLTFRTKGSDISDRFNIVEYVSCKCGSTAWGFNNNSVQKRPEITNRKGRYKYPQKFSY